MCCSESLTTTGPLAPTSQKSKTRPSQLGLAFSGFPWSRRQTNAAQNIHLNNFPRCGRGLCPSADPSGHIPRHQPALHRTPNDCPHSKLRISSSPQHYACRRKNGVCAPSLRHQHQPAQASFESSRLIKPRNSTRPAASLQAGSCSMDALAA